MRDAMTAWHATEWQELPCGCAVRLVGHPDGPVLYVDQPGHCTQTHRDAYPDSLWEAL